MQTPRSTYRCHLQPHLYDTHHEHFRIQQQLYRQLSCTATGTRIAPSHAILLMGSSEHKLITKGPHKLLIW